MLLLLPFVCSYSICESSGAVCGKLLVLMLLLLLFVCSHSICESSSAVYGKLVVLLMLSLLLFVLTVYASQAVRSMVSCWCC